MAGGSDAVYAVRARDGNRVWQFKNGGKYANPVVADNERVYITGRSFQYALAPRGSPAARADARAARRKKARAKERAQKNRATKERRRERRSG